MIRSFLKTGLLLVFPFLLQAQWQPGNLDSLHAALKNAPNDSVRYRVCSAIYNYYEELNRDSALYYAEQQLQLSRRNNEKLAETISLNQKGYQLIGMGRYPQALDAILQAFEIAENEKSKEEKSWLLITPAAFSGDKRLYTLAYTHHIFGILMWQTGNTEQEIIHFKKARDIAIQVGHKIRQQMALMNLGRTYTNRNMPDSALLFLAEAEQLAVQTGFKKYLGQIYGQTAWTYKQMGDNDKASQFYYKAVNAATEQKNMNNLSSLYYSISRNWLAEKEKDSSLSYALKSLKIFQTLGGIYGGPSVNLGTIYKNIYLCYKLNGQSDSAYKYLELALNTIDSLSTIRIKNLTDFQNAGFNEQLRLQNVEKERVVYQGKVRIYFLASGIGVLLLLAIIFYRNNKHKHKANQALQATLSDLRSTQAQLVQSEKMASLGELTAGIAHEIQNPLNFVNNFSDLNRELLAEMKEEMNKGNVEDAKSIAEDVINNEDKINHHGKRADAIVKGMLQHSRSSTGQKEPTDINALCDEYLRLAYHGLRAKDKHFNATIKTDFDKSIGNIKVIPQDIGRVVLNLINNAFYACTERLTQANAEKNRNAISEREGLTANSYQLTASPYDPIISITTKKTGNTLEIRVADNGNGIPQKVLDKIFQPFFTTKPTGQGTGLGLSLSYDIIRAHGGEIRVETKEGEGTIFTIQLPTI